MNFISLPHRPRRRRQGVACILGRDGAGRRSSRCAARPRRRAIRLDAGLLSALAAPALSVALAALGAADRDGARRGSVAAALGSCGNCSQLQARAVEHASACNVRPPNARSFRELDAQSRAPRSPNSERPRSPAPSAAVDLLASLAALRVARRRRW